jgi:hypothetical protein
MPGSDAIISSTVSGGVHRGSREGVRLIRTSVRIEKVAALQQITRHFAPRWRFGTEHRATCIVYLSVSLLTAARVSASRGTRGADEKGLQDFFGPDVSLAAYH